MAIRGHRSGALLIALLALPLLATPPASGQTSTTLDDAVYARVNQIRQSFGLSLLARNAQLERAAQFHAEDMARNRFMGHYGVRRLQPFDPHPRRRLRADLVGRERRLRLPDGRRGDERLDE